MKKTLRVLVLATGLLVLPLTAFAQADTSASPEPDKRAGAAQAASGGARGGAAETQRIEMELQQINQKLDRLVTLLQQQPRESSRPMYYCPRDAVLKKEQKNPDDAGQDEPGPRSPAKRTMKPKAPEKAE